MNPQTLLTQLRDNHPPAQIDWWPPAPGWWLLTILLLAGLCFAIIHLIKHYKQNAWRRFVLSELKSLKKDAPELAPQKLIENLNQLLKRSLSAKFNDDRYLALTGNEWINCLSSKDQNEILLSKDIVSLAEDGYQRNTPGLDAEIFIRLEKWVKGL